MYDVVIIGGGLAGLFNALLLQKAGHSVVLFEEKKYPFHRVCGEYISNEVVSFLEANDLFPSSFGPASISKFHLSSTSGKSLKMDLDLGGFGISRFSFDQWLAQKAKKAGVTIREGEKVTKVQFDADLFQLETSKGSTVTGKVVIGSFGKRTRLDKDLNRPFINKRSPYIGVKYHIKTDEVAHDTIELHNFRGGYCGVSKVENDTFNLCYLSHRDHLKRLGTIPALEENVLFQNPHLKSLFRRSDFLFDHPEVINEISFEPKEPVVDHILMSGDAAGMIVPLSGNGMAMAIHSAKILSGLITNYLSGGLDRQDLEMAYKRAWRSNFGRRHWAGRKIQYLFGAPRASEFAVRLGNTLRPVARYLMSQTHGKPF